MSGGVKTFFLPTGRRVPPNLETQKLFFKCHKTNVLGGKKQAFVEQRLQWTQKGLLRISEFWGFQWQTLAEILSLLSKGQFDPIKC